MDTTYDSATQLRCDHAQHNEKVCEYLAKEAGFGDWVITTAFYASVHWASYFLFPREEEDGGKTITVQNIDQYHDVVYGRRYITKHDVTIKLVSEACPEIAAAYESLYHSCMKARYQDYRVSQKLVSKAEKCLKTIREHCDKPKS